jgi:hypothetical protein
LPYRKSLIFGFEYRRKSDSLFAGRDHLNSIDRDDADMSCPRSIRHDERTTSAASLSGVAG